MSEKIDYSKFDFIGLGEDGSILLRRKTEPEYDYPIILLNKEPVSVTKLDFENRMKYLEERISGITTSEQFITLVHYDPKELRYRELQLEAMQRIREKMGTPEKRNEGIGRLQRYSSLFGGLLSRLPL